MTWVMRAKWLAPILLPVAVEIQGKLGLKQIWVRAEKVTWCHCSGPLEGSWGNKDSSHQRLGKEDSWHHSLGPLEGSWGKEDSWRHCLGLFEESWDKED